MADLVIDVGANRGEFAVGIATRNPGVGVLAVEPIPELCAGIVDEARERGLGNVTTRCIAIDTAERSATFHVADHADQGVSSLLEFHAAGLEQDAYWRQREDMHFERSIEVSVRRLDALPEVVAADRIRFIKIDAQGLDVSVLESLGLHLERTEAGMLEVPATHRTRLYEDEAHDLHSATSRLLELGFAVHAIKPNDPAANEFNLYFHRKDLDPAAIERDLGLTHLNLYDGKHYWHLPSDRLWPDAVADPQRFLARLAELEELLGARTDRLKVVEDALARECAETRRLAAVIAERDTLIHRLQMSRGQLR